MLTKLKKFLPDPPLTILIILGCVFFFPFFLFGRLPIPADTIVGMYHPWRDKIWDNFTQGVPFKNFLITDPVRQQYVWRKLAVDQWKDKKLPVWNPYSFSGTPLLANVQSAVFYPGNILFFFFPFEIAWSLLVVLQPILAGIFLYKLLRFYKLSGLASLFGALSFAYSGFNIAWLEWNTIIHVLLWLPLILLSQEHLLKKITFKWAFIYILAFIMQIFAGHLQILFYSVIFAGFVLIIRLIQNLNSLKKFFPILILASLAVLITIVQWLPTLNFIFQSTRLTDNYPLSKEWFIPWQNLVQFIVPDFFGNPSTNNYWGIWNYGEFIGYIGIVPLLLSFYAILTYPRRNFFLILAIFVSLLFALPTPLAKFFYRLNLPLISTSQPTRLIAIIDFSLAILAAFGFNELLKSKNVKKLNIVIILFWMSFIILWFLILNVDYLGLPIHKDFRNVTVRNLILPTLTTIIVTFLLKLYLKFKSSKKNIIILALFLITVLDLFRFGWKFISFSPSGYLYPSTEVIEFLKADRDYGRIMSLNREILAANFSTALNLQDVGGYDPLYLKSYAEYVSAWERGKPDLTISPFNRIINPTNFDSVLADLLGVKYILSLNPISSPKLTLKLRQGQTFVYENTKSFPRVYLSEKIRFAQNEEEVIKTIFNLQDNLRNTSVLEDQIALTDKTLASAEFAQILTYEPNYVRIQTFTAIPRILILTDLFYPTWKAAIDGIPVNIIKVNLIFRGVVVPTGEHVVEYKSTLL